MDTTSTEDTQVDQVESLISGVLEGEDPSAVIDEAWMSPSDSLHSVHKELTKRGWQRYDIKEPAVGMTDWFYHHPTHTPAHGHVLRVGQPKSMSREIERTPPTNRSVSWRQPVMVTHLIGGPKGRVAARMYGRHEMRDYMDRVRGKRGWGAMASAKGDRPTFKPAGQLGKKIPIPTSAENEPSLHKTMRAHGWVQHGATEPLEPGRRVTATSGVSTWKSPHNPEHGMVLRQGDEGGTRFKHLSSHGELDPQVPSHPDEHTDTEGYVKGHRLAQHLSAYDKIHGK